MTPHEVDTEAETARLSGYVWFAFLAPPCPRRTVSLLGSEAQDPGQCGRGVGRTRERRPVVRAKDSTACSSGARHVHAPAMRAAAAVSTSSATAE